MTKANAAASISKRLSNLAQGQGVAFQSIATSFLIERLVARLTSDKRLKESLVFKGGYVGLRVYDSNRFTVDLDALLTKSDLAETLSKTREAAESDLGDTVWFRFEKQIDLKTQGEYGGIRQVFRTGIGEPLDDLKRPQIVNFDIGSVTLSHPRRSCRSQLS